MGILRSVVKAFARTMLNTWYDLSLCRVIGSELVGNHHPWRMALAFQQLAHQAFGYPGIATALHQNLQHKSVLINGTP